MITSNQRQELSREVDKLNKDLTSVLAHYGYKSIPESESAQELLNKNPIYQRLIVQRGMLSKILTILDLQDLLEQLLS